MKTLWLKTTIIFIFLFQFSCSSLPSQLPPQGKLCPDGDCRGPVTIKLIKEDGSIFEEKHDYYYPIMQPDGITILPGETLRITGTFNNDILRNIRVLKESDPETPLLTFKFWQVQDGSFKSMNLQVVNNTKHDIKYHLAMMPLSENKFHKTSTLPVRVGIMTSEWWHEPIYQLVVREIFIIVCNGRVCDDQYLGY